MPVQSDLSASGKPGYKSVGGASGLHGSIAHRLSRLPKNSLVLGTRSVYFLPTELQIQRGESELYFSPLYLIV